MSVMKAIWKTIAMIAIVIVSTITIIITMLILLIRSAFSNNTTQYEFLYSERAITSVTIVKLGLDENNEIIQTELCEIEDIDGFLVKFKDVRCYNPAPPHTDAHEIYQYSEVVFKIVFKSGEYELISYMGQSQFNPETGLTFRDNMKVFEKTEFENLRNYYLDTAN